MKKQNQSILTPSIPSILLLPYGLILLVFYLLLISGCTERNALMIINESATDIVVVNAKVNEQTISDKELFIASSPQRYSPVPVYAYWEKDNSKILEISITYKGGAMNARCTLNDEPESCLFKAFYEGTTQLKCVCDSYADFNY